MPRSTLHRASSLLLALAAIAGCSGRCERPWYADGDGDGFGDRSTLIRACEAPEAHVADPSDCDDREPEVRPDAVEACNGRDDDCDGVLDPEVRTWFADADGDGFGTSLLTAEDCAPPDGFVERAGDCDDGDPTIRPEGSLETCDGRDQDCDGLVDEGAPGTDTYYPDEDFDGQGDANRGQSWCERPAGWVLLGTDCDDDDSSVYFGANEVCNGHDDDCDALVDDDDPGVTGQLAFWDDRDEDGFGTGTAQWACEVPSKYAAAQPGDCDDAEAAVNPGETEVCGGVDEDCDGLEGDLDPSVDTATQVLGWADRDGDGLGDPDLPVAACVLAAGAAPNADDCDDADRFLGEDLWLADLDGDGVGAGTPATGEGCAPPPGSWANAAAGGDCADGDPTIRPRVPDACGDGVDQDCTGVDPACRPPLDGLTGLDEAHRGEVSGLGAVDALGSVLGPPGDLDGDGRADTAFGAPGADEVRIVLGPPPEVPGPWAPARTVAGPGLGRVVAIVPDATGDGRAELVLGAPDEGAGVVYVLDDGGLAGTVDAARAEIAGTLAGDRVGAAISAIPDTDGDGVGELAIGAPGINGGNGVLARFALEGTGQLGASAAELTVSGSGGFGSAISPAGDASGDGDLEIAVGAPGISAIYLIATDWNGVWAASTIDRATVTAGAGTALGAAVDLSGDLDGDGLVDLVGAAPEDGSAGADAGRVYVWADPQGNLAAEATAAFQVEGDAAGAGVAQSVATADLDGDGAADLLLGVAGADLTGVDAGAVYVFAGPLSGSAQAADATAILYGAVGERAGAALAPADLDGDGWDDLWVGAPGAPGIGRAFWVPGAF